MSDTSRDRILNLLKRSDAGMTIEQLCAELSVTPMAVHRQMKVLESSGLVKSETIHGGRGRPYLQYSLTPSAEAFFPNDYSRILLELLKDVRWREGATVIRKLFESRFKKLFTESKKRIHGSNFAANVAQACAVLEENGYMAEKEQITSTKFRIKLYNCPTPQVAKEFAEICSCEKCYLGDLLQAKVRRDRHILTGHNYCSYIAEKK